MVGWVYSKTSRGSSLYIYIFPRNADGSFPQQGHVRTCEATFVLLFAHWCDTILRNIMKYKLDPQISLCKRSVTKPLYLAGRWKFDISDFMRRENKCLLQRKQVVMVMSKAINTVVLKLWAEIYKIHDILVLGDMFSWNIAIPILSYIVYVSFCSRGLSGASAAIVNSPK